VVSRAPRAGKRPFELGRVLQRVRAAVLPLPKAAMFAWAEEGHRTLFEQLVACVLSIRTRDEVSLVASRRLFQAAPTPQAMAGLPVGAIDRLIGDVTFHRPKADQIREIAYRTVTEHGGTLPCSEPALRSFRGVGPKCANLALGIACAERSISVDIHVHRVTNRWGNVESRRPEGTMRELEQKLPWRYWIEINALLVPFGKHICTGEVPRCSTCPVREWCRQVGVTRHR
jgi:endonuclease-3